MSPLNTMKKKTNHMPDEETIDAALVPESPVGDGGNDAMAAAGDDGNDVIDAAGESEPAADQEDEAGEFEDDDPDLKGILEALIFASDEPLAFRQIKELLAPGESEGEENVEEEASPVRARRRNARRLTITHVKRAIDTLNDAYADQGRSFRIIEVSGGFAFQTTAAYGAWVGRLFAERSRRRLTQSALETLSIIAFRQPISKPAVEGIRGVNAEYVVKSLLERNLISIVGREDSPGRPLLYGTTKTFLKHFGLSSINDLPKPREIKDLLSSDEELAINPIDEMDPEKAVALTRVSSQELERLFDSARLRSVGHLDPGSEDDAAIGEVAEESASEDGVFDERDTDVEHAEATDEDVADAGEDNTVAAPVLHVQFDSVSDDEDDADAGDDVPAAEDAPSDDERPDEEEPV